MIPLEWMAPLMFAGLIVFMLIGYPVAFSLAAIGLLFGFISIGLGFFEPVFMSNLPLRVFGILSNELLLAIPFFTFMGAVLERCGLAEDLLEGTGQLFGAVPGGLAYAVIVVGAILGAITGTVAASVIAMGVISLPIMMRYGYDMKTATGVIAASGTITQLIPPSLVLVVLADQIGRSVGDMYAGAIGPSIVQMLLFMAYIFALSLFRPRWVPPLPPQARTLRGWPLAKRVLWGMVPSLALIFLVLGTIFMGLATATEAGAMGAVGAVALAVLRDAAFSRLGKWCAGIGFAALAVLLAPAIVVWKDHWFDPGLVAAAQTFLDEGRGPLLGVFYAGLVVILIEAARIAELRGLIRQGFESTMRLTAMVIFILIGSTVFSLVFQGVDGGKWIEHMLSGLPGGQTGFLIFVALFVFLLAFFLDFFEIAFIVVPLLAPVAQKLGIDLVWFGVLLCVMLQTSFMHPPFGFALFYLRGIAPREVKSSDIYWGALPWVILQIIMAGIVVFWPALVTGFIPKAEMQDPAKVEIILEAPVEQAPPALESPGSGEKPKGDAGTVSPAEDPAAEIERMLRQGR
jgi:TRAP-type mannitol/chloroaromatic compound transport system permease large subunit